MLNWLLTSPQSPPPFAVGSGRKGAAHAPPAGRRPPVVRPLTARLFTVCAALLVSDTTHTPMRVRRKKMLGSDRMRIATILCFSTQLPCIGLALKSLSSTLPHAGHQLAGLLVRAHALLLYDPHL